MRKRLIGITRLFAAVVFLFGLVSPVQPAKAYATVAFNVNSSGDQSDANPGNGVCATSGGGCTLRAAIQEADRLNNYTVNITIPAMQIKLGSELSLTFLDNTDSTVNITGAGEGQTILDGQNVTRIFKFITRSGTNSISSMTLQNGYNTTLKNDPADYRTGIGGAIFADTHLDLRYVTFNNNTALWGGALYVEFGPKPTSTVPWHPIVNLYGVHFTNNKALSTDVGKGGGAFFLGSELHGNFVYINNNSSQSQAGGVYINSFYTMELLNFTILSNVAVTDAGGVDVDLGMMNLYDGVVSGNHSGPTIPGGRNPGGAGIYVNGSDDAGQHLLGEVYLKRVAVSNNVAEAAGAAAGGIYSRGHLVMEEVSVTGNVAAYGAGIYNGDDMTTTNSITMKNSTIAGNVGRDAGQIASEGGGIYNRSGAISIFNSTITQNAANISGGISNHLGGVVWMANTIFTLNGAFGGWGSPECFGSLSSGDYNIVGALENNQYPTLNCTMNYQAHDKRYINPLLGVLNQATIPAYYPLQGNSPAINAGGAAYCTSVDALGRIRPVGPACDIGAYEWALQVHLPLVRK